MTAIRSVTLHCAENGSDKIYALAIEPKDDAFVVTFANGRRGSTLTKGLKTKDPVDEAKASKVFEKTMNEKIAKGYKVVGGDAGGGAAALQGDLEQRSTGFAPMLCNPVEAAAIDALINDAGWLFQRKFDGERRGVIVANGETVGANRRGLSVPLPVAVANYAATISPDMILDGEMLGDRFVVFDVLRLHGVDLRDKRLDIRLAALEALDLEDDGQRPIFAAASKTAAQEKRDLLAALKAANLEGVVAKYAQGAYRAGRPASGGDWVKFKFVETLSAIVESCNAQRSVNLALIGADGARIAVGAVTIPANHDVPPVGAVVEVRYLYAYEFGSLYQPVYLGRRDDIDAAACLASQRKFAPADKAA